MLQQTVTGSYDPNDKAVGEGATVSLAPAQNGFTYTVRFQNTGTAPAQRVVIEDFLESGLNLSTLEVISASHDYTLQRFYNKLVFWFENINLPAAQDDEAGSHGYITFHVKPTASVAIGSEFTNAASIFFDYNFPIITNEVLTEVVALGLEDLMATDTVRLFPNPAKNVVNVTATSESSISIYNISGQLLLEDAKALEHPIDVSGLSAGTYLVRIKSHNGETTKKLVRM